MFPELSWFEFLYAVFGTFVGISAFLVFVLELKGERRGGIFGLMLWPVLYLVDIRVRKKHPQRATPMPSVEENVRGFLWNVKMAAMMGALATALSWGLLGLVIWLSTSTTVDLSWICFPGESC